MDPQTIIYNDISEWMDDEIHSIPNYYIVDVRFPNSSMYSLKVRPLTSTVIRASDIGISKFKDGIYCFIIDPLSEESGGCGTPYTKSWAVLPNIRCCLDQGFSTLPDDKYYDLVEVERWIRKSEESSSLGQEIQSKQEYTIAKKLLDKLNCECNC
ncbi:MAG: hypothetical protein J5I47_04715 [Vicingus serpentipes]|nr:hypothetical protein [Vicingus serpentipes]